MSATIQQETTMTVSRSTVIDMLAAIQAAGSIVWTLDDEKLSREFCSDVIAGIAARFRKELFGPYDDVAAATDPTNVELMAREDEIEADIIAGCFAQDISYEKTKASLEARDGREAQLREHARRIRDAGTEDVMFPTSDEMLEMVRTRMNSAIEEGNDA